MPYRKRLNSFFIFSIALFLLLELLLDLLDELLCELLDLLDELLTGPDDEGLGFVTFGAGFLVAMPTVFENSLRVTLPSVFA